ncbi:DNA-binding transcriptional regulator YhcF (GntR family) [Microbacterium endophyticum]|uniref:DNA-binding transcriptional regulator YhcF (GntR family) n=1 Tax=Microbacterium endophyticum TaxID=1526412 RepID=A0A7W4YP12_9MICO|nr:GntR family transcriptional regulator [Microbacterium endophyticum]MBB2976717.1 DNA-binding transcriptional regulator YhcF (GntR family) [Microbacterium endophyticum]NIK36647.1 DNA-binding transcriptional regulator YhcF (GntR family) [Microbacterium endophyticum]
MIVIDPRSSLPPFEQVREQLLGAVADGELAPGARLPTVRHLAEELGVAAGTVARAYRELEASGVIETRGRNGTFVSPYGDAARREAQRAATVFADQMRALRFDTEEALALVSAALRKGPTLS